MVILRFDQLSPLCICIFQRVGGCSVVPSFCFGVFVDFIVLLNFRKKKMLLCDNEDLIFPQEK